MNNFITVEELQKAYNDYIIIDCRGDLVDHAAGEKMYATGHLPGAFFLDVHKDLAGPVGEHGGRHPLPDMNIFVKKLEQLGISNNSKIVVYDEWIFASARLWWMLKYIGIPQVQILAGGFAAWLQSGGDVTSEVPLIGGEENKAGKIELKLQTKKLVDMETVKALTKTKERLLVDCRGAARYRGEVEPMDRVAGHIPTAVNVFYELGFTEIGLKSEDELKEIYKTVLAKDHTPVAYCGSGISAPVGILAMEAIGLEPILYLGSYSDWVSYPDNLVAVGEEN